MNPSLSPIHKNISSKSGGKNRLPSWFRQEIPDTSTFEILRALSGLKINTVCQQARCPNLSRCFKNKELTFMILGNTCTRNCRFCAVAKSGGASLSLDEEEPSRIAQAIMRLGLDYAVITSVTRDDLLDSGAGHFAKTLASIHAINRNIKVELLIPDFKADYSSLKNVIDARPCVVAHNLETVKRLYRELKPDSDYEVSLNVLRRIKEIKPGLITKSSLLLGLGETKNEVISAMQDLKDAFCDILVLGQYLAPTLGHYPVRDFIGLNTFREYQDIGAGLGFKAVSSGPLVRSSYKAHKIYQFTDGLTAYDLHRYGRKQKLHKSSVH
jgi:lipoic acid synthetase